MGFPVQWVGRDYAMALGHSSGDRALALTIKAAQALWLWQPSLRHGPRFAARALADPLFNLRDRV
ncbi:hypothetical protein CKO11_00485 [Rhodobacter sp. TJ_12]|nr:hypothetical protein [Rhodobacter sp. TJ_12]